MKGYVALTDIGWYTYLCSQPRWDEVNFWQPRGGTLLDPPIGTPFFLKLHASHGSWIVGFGYFSCRSRLPAWMAWDAFQGANGAPDRSTFLRLLADRRSEPVDLTGSFAIGCLLISQPVFFEKFDWVRPPTDWPRTGIQQGKYYELAEGEGLRLYEACQARAIRYPQSITPAAGASAHGDAPGERFGAPYMMRPRLGQGGFRVSVTDAYCRACAVTTEHSLPVLDAAHIRPFGEGGEHEIRNGILLRADIHRLFDLGLVTVTPEHQFLVSPRLRSDYRNGRVYYDLERQVKESGGIQLPADPGLHPDPDLLQWHTNEKFVA